MGRKGVGGGSGTKRPRRQSELSPAIIHRRIGDCKINHLSFEDIADHLYSSYPDYKQYKLLPFRSKVTQILQKSHRLMNPPQEEDNEDDDDDEEMEEQSTGPRRKKQRELGETDDHDHAFSYSDSESSVSTSDHVHPEFDLMKDMLRVGYGGLKLDSKSKEKAGEEEKNMEVEDVRKQKTVASSMTRGGKNTSGVVEGSDSGKRLGGGSSVEVVNKGNQGPTFEDLGGMKDVLEKLKMDVIFPLKNPLLSHLLGVEPVTGILLHGPPGCGKTKLAQAIANESGCTFYQISATEVVSGVSGASEENIRDLFSKAYRTAPSIIFIDEIDAIASKRENSQREMERRIVTQLLTCMDESHRLAQSIEKNSNSEVADNRSGYVLVIGATNRPDTIDCGLRRPGRFDIEISLEVPDENARLEILSLLTQNARLSGDISMMKIAKATPGFVGADLVDLVKKANNLAMKRLVDERRLEDGEHDKKWWRETWSPEETGKLSVAGKLSITMFDYEEAAKVVQPSLRREGFSSIPDVKWDDVGGLDVLREEFYFSVVKRIKDPELYEESGEDMDTGYLLYGPPGCGKTLIAKAVANEAGVNFIHIKGPELLNKYVGESELNVRTIFNRARTCAPCILFFDEVDVLTTNRGNEGGSVVERVTTQLLVELDGGDKRRGVYVIGATNRPHMMDKALLRPGRFGKPLYVPLPTPTERGLILKTLARKRPIDPNVDLLALGLSPSCEGLSGADLAVLVHLAGRAAVREKQKQMESVEESFSGDSSSRGGIIIKSTHFEQALRKVSPSVSAKEIRFYQRLSVKFLNIRRSVPDPRRRARNARP